MLIGNVGKDPEVRYLDGNAKVATVTLATTERYKDRAGNLQESTEWHTIILWRNLADIVEKYVKKGSQIYVEGRIRTRSWTDQTGAKKYTTEIQADNMQLLGKRSENQDAEQGAPAQSYSRPAAPAPAPVAPAPVAPTSVAPAAGEDNDDLPF